MDLSLTPEQIAIRETAREVALSEFGQGAGRDLDSPLDPRGRNRLADVGFLGIAIAARYGGLGGSLLDALLVLEQFAKVSVPAAFQIFEANFGAARVVELIGSTEQGERWLPSVISGRKTIALAISEPDAGSAATDLTTRAVPTSRGYTVNGRKRWCSGAGSAEQYLVYVRMSDEPGARGIGAVLVEREAPGVSFGPRAELMGLSPIPTADMILDDLEVLAGDVVVPAGGFGQLFSAFSIERLGNATMSLAIAQACLDATSEYVVQRKQFGREIADYQMVQSALAEMVVTVEAARLLIYRAAVEAGTKWPSALSSSAAKYYANVAGKTVSDLAIQLHGAYGYSREYQVERLHRDAHGWALAGGTLNMQRIRIASEYLGRRFDQRSGAGRPRVD